MAEKSVKDHCTSYKSLLDDRKVISAVIVGLAPLLMVATLSKPPPESFLSHCLLGSRLHETSSFFESMFASFSSQWLCSNGGYFVKYGIVKGAYQYHDLVLLSLVETLRGNKEYHLGILGTWFGIPCALNTLTSLFFSLYKVHAVLVLLCCLGLVALALMALFRYVKLAVLAVCGGLLGIWFLSWFSAAPIWAVLVTAAVYGYFAKSGYLAPLFKLFTMLQPPSKSRR